MAEIGNVNEELVLNCSGSLKIRRGNDLIEFFDSYGNPNIKLKNVVKDGQPNYNSVDGIYFDGINTYIKSGNTIKTISLSLGGNTSLPEGTILLYKGVTNPTGWYFYPESTGIDGLIYISNKQYTGRASIELYERGSITKSATVGDTYNLPFSEIAARYATTLADYSDISGELYFEVTGANGYTNCATLSDDDTYLTFDRFGECKVTARVDGTSSHTAASYEYILKINKKTYNLLFLDPPQISTSVNTWIHLLDYIDKPTFGDNNLLNEVKFYLNGLLVTEYMQLTSVGYNSVLAILPSTNLYEEAKSGYLTFMVSNSGTTDYNGSVQSFDIFGNSSTPVTIRYMKTLTNTKPSNKSEFTTSVPNALDAGTYYIWYTINNGDIDGPVVRTISPKVVSNPTIILSLSNYTYDGNAKTPTVIVKDGNHVILASEYTVSYSNNKDVGTATVTVTNVTGGNYVVNGSTTFTISSTPKASITTAPTAKTLTYSGDAQDLVNAGTASNGTVYYKVTTSDTKPSDTSGFSSSIPTGTNAGTYYVWYYAKGDTGYDDGDISSSAVSVTIAQEEETIETSASITNDYITEYQSGGNSIDNNNVKVEIVNNSSNTLISSVVFNNLNSEDTWGAFDNGDVTLSLTNNINSGGTTVEYNGGTLNDLDGKTPVPSSYQGFSAGNVHMTINADLNQDGFNDTLSGHVDDAVLTTYGKYSKGKCYTLTVNDGGITVSVGDNIQSGSYVTSDSEIKVKIKNNTESSLTLTGAIKFKNGNTDIVSTTFNNSSVTINSGSSSTEYEIDFGNNAVTNTPSLTSIELTTSSNETISIALTNATFNMGALYTITYGSNSTPISYDSDDIAGKFWAPNNYKVDLAIDSYFVHNYNMGAQTHNDENLTAWEDYTDKDKRNLLMRAACISVATYLAFYTDKYFKYTGVESDSEFDFNRYVFEEISESEYNANDGNEDNKYLLEAPFSGIDILNNNTFSGRQEVSETTYRDENDPNILHTYFESPEPTYGTPKNSTAFNFIKEVLEIGDNAARLPLFDVNWGRVRPLGSTTHPNRVYHSGKGDDIGDMWNGILNGTLCQRYSDKNEQFEKNVRADDIPGDGPTSHPSGHASQTWAVAMMIVQALYDLSDNIILDYIAKAYEVGVERTIARFHWNSDIMYGKVFATMIIPIINAMGGLLTGYTAFCNYVNSNGDHNKSLPTETPGNDSLFSELITAFGSIVTIDSNIEKYLWSMYKVADTAITQGSLNILFNSNTYPDKFPESGYPLKINNTTTTIKYRGNNETYYNGSTVLSSLTNKKIMLSWLMAICLSELYADLSGLYVDETNNINLNYSFTNPSTGVTTYYCTDAKTNLGVSDIYNNLNTQTKLFTKAYELGGGRELDLYHEYKLTHDPTILRLAASIVYARERGKYSYSTIRTLGISPNPLANLSTNDSLECTADRNNRYYKVGYGVNTYFIFNDAPGPYKYGRWLVPAPYQLKSIGTSTLTSQHLNESLFIIRNVPTLDEMTFIINNTTTSPATINGELRFYLSNPQDDKHGWDGIYNESGTIILCNGGDTIPAGGSETYVVTSGLMEAFDIHDENTTRLIVSASDLSDASGGSHTRNVKLYIDVPGGHDADTIIVLDLPANTIFENEGTYTLNITSVSG